MVSLELTTFTDREKLPSTLPPPPQAVQNTEISTAIHLIESPYVIFGHVRSNFASMTAPFLLQRKENQPIKKRDFRMAPCWGTVCYLWLTPELHIGYTFLLDQANEQ